MRRHGRGVRCEPEPWAHAAARPVLTALWAEFGRGQAAADGVYATLRQAIVTGQLQPGERLAEEHLARNFGVSRTPVREAILRLETEQLAFREERRGAVVGAIREQDLLEALAVRGREVGGDGSGLAAAAGSVVGAAACSDERNCGECRPCGDCLPGHARHRRGGTDRVTVAIQ